MLWELQKVLKKEKLFGEHLSGLAMYSTANRISSARGLGTKTLQMHS